MSITTLLLFALITALATGVGVIPFAMFPPVSPERKGISTAIASGLMGVVKPDEAFFEMVSDELAVEPDEMMLIDDSADNIEAAEACGWQVHWFDGEDYDGLEAKLTEVGAI